MQIDIVGWDSGAGILADSLNADDLVIINFDSTLFAMKDLNDYQVLLCCAVCSERRLKKLNAHQCVAE